MRAVFRPARVYLIVLACALAGLFVAADAVYNETTEAFHEDDIYNPIDPAGLAARLGIAGFDDIHVDTFEFGWKCTARAR